MEAKVCKITRVVVACLVAIGLLTSNASAINEVQWLTNMNPPSSWFNKYEQDVQVGVGQWIFASLGSTNGTYNNISVSPVTGLYVAAGPSTTNSIGSVYQYVADELNPFGGYPAGVGSAALPPDTSLIFQQGMTFAIGTSLGPLTPPGSAGLTTDYLIEGQVAETDTSNQSITIIQPSTSLQSIAEANRDHNRTVIYQTKLLATRSTTSAITTPTVDSGWVGIAIVSVPNGTSTITQGMISTTLTPPFSGFVNGSSGCAGSRCFVDTSTNQIVGGTKTFTNNITTSGSLTAASVFSGPISGSTASFTAGVTINGTLGVTGATSVSGGISGSSAVFNNGIYSTDGAFYFNGGSQYLYFDGTNIDASAPMNIPGITDTGTFSSSSVATGTLTSTGITSTGGISAATNVNTGTITASGNVAVGGISSTGGITATTLGLTGSLSAASVGATGDIRSGTIGTYDGINGSYDISGGTLGLTGSEQVHGIFTGTNADNGQNAYVDFTAGIEDYGLCAANAFSFLQNRCGGPYRNIIAGVYTNASDRRWKRNIKPTKYGLRTIEKLKPRDFIWKADNKPGTGFVAQEIKQVLPQFVSDNRSGYLSVNYIAVIPILVKAIQEQQKEIEALQREHCKK